ncbi:membrane-bound PQQ-dependent dehydrogenase, glucose/quinate/shikimate family [soil metagenome]
MSREHSGRSVLTWVASAVLLLIGAVLTVGGGQLLILGGSAYYLIAGLLVIASAVFTWRRSALGPWLYGVMLVLTVAWAIWESGFDGWALTARLLAPFVLGLIFLLPGVGWTTSGAIERPSGIGRTQTWPAFAIGLVAALLIGGVAFASGPHDNPDPVFQAGKQAAVPQATAVASANPGDWLNYGNDAGGTRFSPLTQLTPDTARNLKVAWSVDLGKGPNGVTTQLEVTPIKVGSSLYVCTAANDVISINAQDGHVNWRFRSGNQLKHAEHAACRGVAYYRVPNMTGPCAERIITATTDARLIALDAASGAPCQGFGVNGQTSLIAGMGNVSAGYYYISSAPTIVRGRVILGGWVADGQYWGEPSGVIRAFDAVTGQFVWAFDMGRPGQKGEPGPGETYTHSTPNSWAPMSADEGLGLVYAPTGNATPDYYGAQRRPFDDRYSSSVVALDVTTGDVRWSFQTTHHDLWDYDVASQPTLVDIPAAGGVQHALLAPTKRGELFLLDRVTGRPLATVDETPAPQGRTAPGERLSPTQPFSGGMPSFRGPTWKERDMWGLTPIDQMMCRIDFRKARYDGPLTPPSPDVSTIAYPGYLGGIDWGGVSVDRSRNLVIVNSSRVGNYDRLIPRAAANKAGLVPMGQGGGVTDLSGASPQSNTPYAAGVRPFLSVLGAPCNEPPYGMLSAVDLTTHKVVWTRPVGTARDSGPLGIRSLLPIPMGLPMSGGTMTTAGGLIFMGSTQESTFRAFDVTTGKEVWSARLPAGGQATPMTYLSPASNRQFVVIAAGGNFALRSKLGSTIVAYAVPK